MVACGRSSRVDRSTADNSLAPNWADSDESSKAPWTIISATAELTWHGRADELQVLLQGVANAW